MREAERKEAAAVQYAQAVEKQRQLDLSKLNAVNTEYTTKLEENVTSAMESAQKRVANGNRITRCKSTSYG